MRALRRLLASPHDTIDVASRRILPQYAAAILLRQLRDDAQAHLGARR